MRALLPLVLGIVGLFLLFGCTTAPPRPTACGAGGEVATFPPGLIPGIDGKVPVNVGRGPGACPTK